MTIRDLLYTLQRTVRWTLYDLRIVGRGQTWAQDDVVPGDLVYVLKPRGRKARYAKYTAAIASHPVGVYTGAGGVAEQYLIYNGQPRWVESVNAQTGSVILSGKTEPFKGMIAISRTGDQILGELRFDKPKDEE